MPRQLDGQVDVMSARMLRLAIAIPLFGLSLARVQDLPTTQLQVHGDTVVHGAMTRSISAPSAEIFAVRLRME